MEAFLRSGQSTNYCLTVEETNATQKVSDILTADKGKIKVDYGLYIKPGAGPNTFDLTGADLFSMMSPCLDPFLHDRSQRDVILCSGMSGSGKSTWCSQYARSYQKDKSKRIILFSSVKTDPAFDDIKNLKQVPFDELVDDNGEPLENIDIEMLSNSLVILDDIDMCANKKLRKYLQDKRDELLQHGRHNKIDMLITNHQIMAYQKTKIILMEASKVVVFPGSTDSQIKRFLKAYCDFTPDQIKKFFKIKSRWIMLSKTNPRYVLYANGCYLL